ncbi:protein kinase [Streptomyces sp. NBC_00536]|uniref:serine/threonine protein kinase n=1 Tax=Streptomyces sp. NBC_00536 TaxID=2975769 RepID=UPI002E8176AA|nr:protein kinase [Streptomyces sp. NBC_00536]WUC80741.1 protein kinase [Streptomyces sp. NBC_00536]
MSKPEHKRKPESPASTAGAGAAGGGDPLSDRAAEGVKAVPAARVAGRAATTADDAGSDAVTTGGAGAKAARTEAGSAEPRDAISGTGDEAAPVSDAAAPKPGVPDAASPAAGPQGAEPADAEPQDAEPKVALVKEAERKGAGPQDAQPKGVEPKGAEPKVALLKDAEPEDAEPAGDGVGEVLDVPGILRKPGAKGGQGDGGSARVTDGESGAAARAGRKSGTGAGAGTAAGAGTGTGAGGGAATAAATGTAAGAATGTGTASQAGGVDEGRLLARRYRLGRVLGKGGMGTVWRAKDITLGRTVAVKELRFGHGVDEDEKRRLITRTLREAKAIARIRSGGAVTVYDVVDEDDRPWIVMELIEGLSLAEFIRERGPLTPRRAAEVGLAVLDVLKAAHGEGILHRDVKPSNVLIAENGRVVLTDFGIAQVEGDPSVTSTGMLVGAPSYISPERARGYKPGPPADMWSLGGLIYASVEGTPPYDKGSALATLTAVMTEPVDPPKNAGPLTEVIYGLLAKDPAHRLDDAGARAMLNAVLDAPEAPPAPLIPAVEETRQISLAEAQQAAADKTAEKAAERAAEKAEKAEQKEREREQRERARAALKSARKAAAAAAAEEKAAAAAAASAASAASAAEAPAAPATPSRIPRISFVPAPLTDVMSRRTIALAIAGLVLVLAVIGSLIVYAFSGDDDPGAKNAGKGTGGSTASAGAKTSPSASGDGKGNGNTGATGGTSPSPDAGSAQQTQGQTQGQSQGQGQAQTPGQNTGQLPGQGAGGGVPAGYATVTNDKYHFSMAMPQGFHQTGTAGESSGGIYSRDGGFPRIQVDYTNSPGNDARLAWAKSAPAVAGSSQDYKLLGLRVVDYRGYPTVADWEFERTQNGMKVRVLNRGFKMDATHGYAIMISCASDQWDGAECTQMRNTAFDTFQPVG